jgi:hypothetical protein
MFYFVIPHKRIPLTEVAAPAKYLQLPLQAIFNPNTRATAIMWQVEPKRQEAVGFLDVYSKVHDGRQFLDAFSLEFEYKVAQYINFEDVVKEILSDIFAKIEDFTIKDLYLKRDIVVTDNESLEQAIAIVIESRTAAFSQESALLNAIANDTDVEKVIAQINELPELFRIFPLSAYVAQLKRGNQNTQQRVAQVIAPALVILNKLEDEHLKALLAFKLILYYKSFSSSYIDLLPLHTILVDIAPFYMSLPIAKEVSQLLLADLALYLTNSPDPASSEQILVELLQLLKKDKDRFLLYPEVRTIRKFSRTGSYSAAFETFMRLQKQQPLHVLRTEYELAFLHHNLITEFTEQVLLQNYYPKLSWQEKFKYYFAIRRFKSRKIERNHISEAILIISGVFGLIFLIAPFIYAEFSAQNGVVINDATSYEFLTTFVVLTMIVTGLVWYCITVAHVFIRLLLKNTWPLIGKILGGIFLSASIAWTSLIVFSFVILTQYSALSGDTLWGIRKDQFINGYSAIPVDKIQKTSIGTATCDSKPCDTLRIDMTVEHTDPDKAKISFITDKIQGDKQQMTCTIISLLEQKTPGGITYETEQTKETVTKACKAGK